MMAERSCAPQVQQAIPMMAAAPMPMMRAECSSSSSTGGAPPVAPPAPPAATPPTPTPTPNDDRVAGAHANGDALALEVDFTRLPVQLDARLEALDTEAAMRPTKINVGDEWSKKSQKALLAPPVMSTLRKPEHASEKQKAFDLLDALSRTGSLPIDCASLHVILAATHCFDQSLIDTLVVKNVNPIEKLERSSLIVAETVMGVSAPQLIRPEMYDALSATYSAGPVLLPPAEEGGDYS